MTDTSKEDRYSRFGLRFGVELVGFGTRTVIVTGEVFSRLAQKMFACRYTEIPSLVISYGLVSREWLAFRIF